VTFAVAQVKRESIHNLDAIPLSCLRGQRIPSAVVVHLRDPEEPLEFLGCCGEAMTIALSVLAVGILLLLSAVTLAKTKRSLRMILLALAATFLVATYLVWPRQSARDERLSKYIKNAQVHRGNGGTTITANDPRPLAQAVRALSDNKGWTVDYEDPPYQSKYDLVDDTAPEWRKAHPNEKGVVGVAGGAFHTAFLVNPNDTSIAQEERILDTVVADYNRSGNPGRFIVKNEGDGRFAVVGVKVSGDWGRDQAVSPVLDTRVTLRTETRSAHLTVKAILNAVSAEAPVKLVPGMMNPNSTSQAKVTVGGQNIPARELLAQVLSGVEDKMYWHLYYDADDRTYFLHLLPVRRAP
jgi:membrane protein implicated in regulation of membrane protease activity